jgi:indolepyruvate ferredoxin oxidoreductase, alpha subunit
MIKKRADRKTEDNSNKKLLFGNEAIVQGAQEAGLAFATSYPGTPASEIGDNLAQLSNRDQLYFEYSTNEKVALEVAAGAAFSGIKAMVSMKHYGLNVALDALLPLIYLECPLVVVVVDDPGSWSSVQAEQDSRWFSRLGLIPTLEPSDSQEAKDMIKLAFKLTKDYQLPILVRLTTRVALSRSLVKVEKLPEKDKTKGNFEKPEGGFKLGSQQTVKLRQKLLGKLEKIKKELAETDQLNKINGSREITNNERIGIVTSGVSHLYAQEALRELGLKLPLLKVGLSYPFANQKAKNFIKNLDKVLVLEELDPIIEQEIERVAGGQVIVYGKDLLPKAGEYKPEDIISAIAGLTKQELPVGLKKNRTQFDQEEVRPRTPFFCPGCPHRATFQAVREALGKNKIYGGDIGCYMLGSYPPYQLIDYIVSMGSGIGIGHGISKTNQEKPVVFIGDSTFFHAGIPGLINLVFNQADILLIILDNRYTAMTGQQPNPGTGLKADGKKSPEIKIEKIAQAVGVDQTAVVNVFNLKETIKTVKDLYRQKGVSVLVAKGECRLVLWRRLRKEGRELPKFEIIDQKKVEKLKNLGCPAIQQKKGRLSIDPYLCTGCALCQQIAPQSVALRTTNKNKK